MGRSVRHGNLHKATLGFAGGDAPQAQTEPHLTAVTQRVVELSKSGAQFEEVGQWVGRVIVQSGF